MMVSMGTPRFSQGTLAGGAEISFPLTFNKLELLVTSTPLPHQLGTRDTCFARVATGSNLVQTPGKNPSLWAYEHRQGGATWEIGEKSWERIRCFFFWYPLRVLNKDHLDLNLWTLQWKGHRQFVKRYINLRSNIFQPVSSDQHLGSLLHIGDNTTQYPVI